MTHRRPDAQALQPAVKAQVRYEFSTKVDLATTIAQNDRPDY